MIITLNTKLPAPRPFIIGTDWWTDVDDAVAIRIFARAHKAGIIDIKGICINACMEYSCASLHAFLCGEGLPGMAIGIDRKATRYGGNPPYQKRMAESACDNPSSNDGCVDALRLYRQILAETEAPVELAEIGFCQVLGALLDSPPDDLSPLHGEELVRRKIKHIWAMAGKWDVPEGDFENNFCRTRENMRAASRFYENCPAPVTFLGFETGMSVRSGDILKGRGDMLAQALKDHGSENGRSSWDPMLALLAIAGEPCEAGYRVVHGQAKISPENGKSLWVPDENGTQRYVIKTLSDRFYREAINARIL